MSLIPHLRLGCGVLLILVASCGSDPGSGLPDSGSVAPAASSNSQPFQSTLQPAASSISSNEDWSELVPDWPDGYTRPEGGPYPFGGLEHYRYRVACLRHLGFEVLEASNGVDYFLNSGGMSFESVFEAETACEARPVAMGVVAPQVLGDADRYAQLLEVYECLGLSGFPVPELVTIDAYLDGEPWDPYQLVGGFTSVPSGADAPSGLSEAVDASNACPIGGLGG